MRIDVLKYLRLSVAPVFYRRAAAGQVSNTENRAGSSAGKPDGRSDPAELTGFGTSPPSRSTRTMAATGSNGGGKIKPDKFEKRYSPRRLLLVLAFSILACGLLIKYLFLWFPKLHSTDMPLVVSTLLIIFLSPVLYAFFYKPMVGQFNKLKKAEVKMQELALNDMLTGLYNRRGFLTFANQLMKLSDRTQRGLVLIFADMNSLKQINDDYGHEAGDRAIISIADVLRKTFRDSDIIGRVGGDEFAILAVEAKPESPDALRKRLKENLERTQHNADFAHKLTISLGIIYYDPESPQSIEELLRNADMLMYEDKNFTTTSRPSPHTAGR